MTGPVVRWLGRADYADTVQRMRDFTAVRDDASLDELWICEHAPVFTLGVAAATHHVLDAGDIPVVRTDRGGQVTYHGPGQVVAYPLVDLRRLGIYVKEYVFRLEQALLRTLESVDVTGHRLAGAPGIYVRADDPGGHAAIDARSPAERTADRAAPSFAGLAKIAALGVKVSRHCTYHGVALNVAMDLRPFQRINPCGHAGLATVDLSTIGAEASPAAVAETLATKLGAVLRA